MTNQPKGNTMIRILDDLIDWLERHPRVTAVLVGLVIFVASVQAFAYATSV